MSIANSEDWHKLGSFFQFAGNKIFYVDLGPKGAPAIVFLHGFPTSSYDFYRIVPAIGRALLECRPDATLIEIQESGHYPQLEVPDVVLREMRNFFVERMEEVELSSA
jgi:pimeloyl-ACP methyl ester carboxylesterase